MCWHTKLFCIRIYIHIGIGIRFSGWWEVVVIVIFISEWRRIVERGHGGADSDDGRSVD